MGSIVAENGMVVAENGLDRCGKWARSLLKTGSIVAENGMADVMRRGGGSRWELGGWVRVGGEALTFTIRKSNIMWRRN